MSADILGRWFDAQGRLWIVQCVARRWGAPEEYAVLFSVIDTAKHYTLPVRDFLEMEAAPGRKMFTRHVHG